MMQQNHTNGRLTDRERTPARLIVLRVLFTLFAAGTVVFIFSNSMQSGTASGLRSAAVTEWLNGGLARVGVGWRFSERLVRKLGHFSEYALLGFWLMLRGFSSIGLGGDMSALEFPGAGWTVFTGVLLLLCSLWILFQPLVFGTAAVIVWVGITLLFAGVAACSLALQLRNAHRCLSGDC